MCVGTVFVAKCVLIIVLILSLLQVHTFYEAVGYMISAQTVSNTLRFSFFSILIIWRSIGMRAGLTVLQFDCLRVDLHVDLLAFVYHDTNTR